jgi:hypothetical protein
MKADKKTKFVATIATGSVDAGGEKFADIDAVRDEAIGKPVTFTFGGDVIGGIDYAWIEGDKVEAIGTLSQKLLSPVNLYVVPGGIVHKSRVEQDVKIIEKFEIKEFSVTATPADPNLEPMREWKEENDGD